MILHPRTYLAMRDAATLYVEIGDRAMRELHGWDGAWIARVALTTFREFQ